MPFFHKQERRLGKTSAGRWRFMNGYNIRRAAPCFITFMVLIVQTWRLVESLKHWEREALEPCHAPRADVPTHEVVKADAQRATCNLSAAFNTHASVQRAAWSIACGVQQALAMQHDARDAALHVQHGTCSVQTA